MYQKEIADIYGMLGSPAWWFATVLVSLLVNIVASFIYNAIKPSVTSERFFLALVVLQGFFFFLSCLYFEPKSHYARAILPGFGRSVATGDPLGML
jgi:hypothetical protein